MAARGEAPHRESSAILVAVTEGSHEGERPMSEDGNRPSRDDRQATHRKRRTRAIRVGTATIGVVIAALAVVAVVSGSGSPLTANNHALSHRRTAAVRQSIPSAFSPGACMAFPPTSGDRHRTVFLDAGHGGPDPGSLGTTAGGAAIEEKKATLPTVFATMKLLRADGYRVVVSRTRDSAVVRLDKGDLVGRVFTANGEHDDLAARVRCANLSGASALVSVHFDANDDASATGSETIYDAGRSFAARSRTLAMLLQRDMMAAMAARGWRVPDDGVTGHSSGGGEHSSKSVSYGHLFVLGPAMRGYNDHPSDMPGALVEPLFISNPDEGDIAVGAPGQQVLASGIADALEQFLEHSPVPTPHPSSSRVSLRHS